MKSTLFKFKISNRLAFGIIAIGVLLIAFGVLMPQGWYFDLPRNLEAAKPPIEGLSLFRMTLVIEGLVLIAFPFLRWKFREMGTNLLLPIPMPSSDRLSARTGLWILAGITLLALVLRLIQLNTDLWLDEIITIELYSHLSVTEIFGAYVNFNNHLLNTLLIKLSIGVFGENEWAIRLPAALLGTATIPAVYWVSRQLGLPKAASLGIALILAVSYHHIFFSQNARGYIGQVFFSLLASGLLVKALQMDKLKFWLMYMAAMLLNFASLLVSAYVYIGHVAVGLIALFLVQRRGENVLPLFRRLFVVLFTVGFLAFQLYALILPSAYVRSQESYSGDGASGYFSLFSLDLITELVSSISVGIGLGDSPLGALIILAGLVVAGTGFLVLLRRNWALTLALALPGVINVLLIVVAGLTFSPRVFLPVLPFAVMAAIQGVYTLAQLIGSPLGEKWGPMLPKAATAVAVLLVFAVSIMSLRFYYSVPKQPYRASIEYVETQRTDGEMIIVVDLAEDGYRYYGERAGYKENEDYFIVRSVDDLDVVLSSNENRDSIVVTTLSRFLHLRKPELESRIEQDWSVVRTFPATIGNGQIEVWTTN